MVLKNKKILCFILFRIFEKANLRGQKEAYFQKNTMPHVAGGRPSCENCRFTLKPDATLYFTIAKEMRKLRIRASKYLKYETQSVRFLSSNCHMGPEKKLPECRKFVTRLSFFYSFSEPCVTTLQKPLIF